MVNNVLQNDVKVSVNLLSKKEDIDNLCQSLNVYDVAGGQKILQQSENESIAVCDDIYVLAFKYII